MHKGLRLATIGKGDPGAHLRPTPDRVRESLFNALAARRENPLTGAHVLDLFAGTGAMGLEALSRGAARAIFVDNGRTARRLLADNIARTGSAQITRVIARDASRLPACDAVPATLVFLDPPYGQGVGGGALVTAVAGGWIAPGALVVWEDSERHDPPAGFTLDSHRRYGTTHVTLLIGPADPELEL